MEIRGLLFDLDGVITETSEFHFLAWKELADSIGIPIDRAFNERLKGVSRMESLERILAHGGRAAAYTEAEKQALAAQKNARYVALLDSLTPADVLPGIRDFMADAKARGIKIAIASASRNAPKILHALALDGLYDTVADPAAVAHSKPAPDIFLLAAQGIAVPTANCVGIEDAEAGIDALRAARIASVGIGSPQYLGKADLVLPDTAALTMDALEKRFG